MTCTTICPFFIDTGMFAGTRTSFLYGMLRQEDVVWRIITAVRQSEGEVSIPWSMGFLTYFCKAFMPSGLMDAIGKHVIGWGAMDMWTGRVGAKAPMKLTQGKDE